MSFEALWKQVAKLGIFPSTAIAQIPDVLSEKTKLLLCQKDIDSVVEIVRMAIEEVEHGSISPIDELIRTRL